MPLKPLSRYTDPLEPGSLGGVQAYARATKQSKKEALQDLEPELSYTLHKPARRRFPTLPTKVFSIDEQFVMDLVDVQKLAKYNRGNKYLLTVIDVLSKYAWVIPLKNKGATAMVEALQKLWKTLGKRTPQSIQTDQGSEFYNQKVQAFFKAKGVIHFSTQGDSHGAVVERFNRTLKTKMYRYFTAHNTLNYMTALPFLVKQYNHTFHRSIQEKPVNVNQSNEHAIWYRLYGHQGKAKPPKCKVGDKVRLNKKFGVFKKSYLPQWTEEVFLVKTIYTRQPMVTYKLTEWDGEDIKGTFYEQDVQKVEVPDNALFRIDKVLKRAKDKVLVAWKGWPSKYNSWVLKSDVQTL